MTLNQLLAKINQANQKDLSIVGRYGRITARPDGGRFRQTREPTYQVDAEYQPACDKASVRVSQKGFRFSTVCCLCAAVCLGEDKVDLQVIANINAQFA